MTETDRRGFIAFAGGALASAMLPGSLLSPASTEAAAGGAPVIAFSTLKEMVENTAMFMQTAIMQVGNTLAQDNSQSWYVRIDKFREGGTDGWVEIHHNAHEGYKAAANNGDYSKLRDHFSDGLRRGIEAQYYAVEQLKKLMHTLTSLKSLSGDEQNQVDALLNTPLTSIMRVQTPKRVVMLPSLRLRDLNDTDMVHRYISTQVNAVLNHGLPEKIKRVGLSPDFMREVRERTEKVLRYERDKYDGITPENATPYLEDDHDYLLASQLHDRFQGEAAAKEITRRAKDKDAKGKQRD